LPTYEYACTACGHRLDAVQKFSDDPLTTCPECGGELRKVYGAVGIAFKGSGFYKTDSRSGGPSGSKAKDGASLESTKTATKSDAPSTPSTKESKAPASSSTTAS
jgi:putative FmdB family regulatory protein